MNLWKAERLWNCVINLRKLPCACDGGSIVYWWNFEDVAIFFIPIYSRWVVQGEKKTNHLWICARTVKWQSVDRDDYGTFKFPKIESGKWHCAKPACNVWSPKCLHKWHCAKPACNVWSPKCLHNYVISTCIVLSASKQHHMTTGCGQSQSDMWPGICPREEEQKSNEG